MFTCDELWGAVMKCWNSFPLDTIARAYVPHSQIAAAIVACDGTDSFVHENKLHMNVRKCCATVCDKNGNPIGVEILTSIEPGDHDNQLRYDEPALTNDDVKANLQRIQFVPVRHIVPSGIELYAFLCRP